jgi:hypothetical protein
MTFAISLRKRALAKKGQFHAQRRFRSVVHTVTLSLWMARRVAAMTTKQIEQGILDLRESKKRHRDALAAEAEQRHADDSSLQNVVKKGTNVLKAWRRFGLRTFLAEDEDDEPNCKELAIPVKLTAAQLCQRADLANAGLSRLVEPGFSKRSRTGSVDRTTTKGSVRIARTPKRVNATFEGESPWKKQRAITDSPSAQLMQSIPIPRIP